MAPQERRHSKISQIVAPIVNITRKLSKKQLRDDVSVSGESDNGDDESEEVINNHPDIPLDFVSQMKEAFDTFDKVAEVSKLFSDLASHADLVIAGENKTISAYCASKNQRVLLYFSNFI